MAMAILVTLGLMALAVSLHPGGLKAIRNGGADAMPLPNARYYAMTIGLSFAAAVAGGWATMRIANHAPLGHVEALAALILVMGVVSGLSRSATRQPPWYRVLIPIIAVAGVATSALIL
jgi:hypothetical protein